MKPVTISLTRSMILSAIAAVSLTLLFVIPAEGCSMTFFLMAILTTKPLAYLGFRLLRRLYSRWEEAEAPEGIG